MKMGAVQGAQKQGDFMDALTCTLLETPHDQTTPSKLSKLFVLTLLTPKHHHPSIPKSLPVWQALPTSPTVRGHSRRKRSVFAQDQP